MSAQYICDSCGTILGDNPTVTQFELSHANKDRPPYGALGPCMVALLCGRYDLCDTCQQKLVAKTRAVLTEMHLHE